ncbi:TlpA family protein disulfide reductase [Aestuariimicrobium sp. Y1814]|uniref:TlpA family protein disulfide reductase n=1 Tax=Aestuariimicrobium sp. Y1814 TaxID=3418742 RepID=UPI003DA793B3
MQSLGLAAPLVLALVLALSGVAKLRSPRAAADSFVSLRMPPWLSNSIAPKVLPWGELVLAVLLLVLPGAFGVVAAGITLALMVTYLVVIARALGFDEPVECGCFGELGLGDVDRRTLWRNAVLVVFGVLAVVAAILDGRAPLLRWWQAGAADWGWLLVCVLVVALAVLIVGGPTPSAASPGRRQQGTAHEPGALDDELVLDYQRQPTPFAELVTPEGHRPLLRDLARQQALLLVFVNSHCAPCLRVSERIDEWSRELHPAVAVRPVYALTGPEELDQSDPRVAAIADRALYDPQHRLAQLLEAHGSPSAVLFGVDDMLAGGPVTGEDAVISFVEEIRAELASAQG